MTEIVMWLFLSRSLVQPINELTQAVESISKGKLDEEVQVTSKDEIGRLAVAYNHMAKSIRETQKVLEKRAEEAVEGRQQVLEAMHVTADAQSAAEASHRRLEESYLKLERQMKEIQAKVVSSVATVERNSSSYSPI